MPAVVLDAFHSSASEPLTHKDVQDLGRSFNPATLARCMNLLTHVRISLCNDGDYLPLELSDRDLFSCLSHLLVHGSQFR